MCGRPLSQPAWGCAVVADYFKMILGLLGSVVYLRDGIWPAVTVSRDEGLEGIVTDFTNSEEDLQENMDELSN